MKLSIEDHERISAAIRASEERTEGEIVCVLAERSSAWHSVPLLLAALIALGVPWLLCLFTAWPVYRILSLQVLTFILLALVLSLPALRYALVPKRLRRLHAHRLAAEQFVVQGLSRTRHRTGILIFVSLADRYARIIADDGIATKVRQNEWESAIVALTSHLGSNRIADGFVSAVDICGNLLATHAPARTGESNNERPNRIYLI